MMRKVLALGFLLVVAMPTAGLAHSERVGSQPKPDARVRRPPSRLLITFSEPPTADVSVEVKDGCGTNVVDDVEVQNLDLRAALSKGQPGRWKVSSSVISGIDGHNTRDSWTFTVEGEADCAKAQPRGDRKQPDDDVDGDGLPVVPIAIGIGAVVLVAVGLRALTGRSDG